MMLRNPKIIMLETQVERLQEEVKDAHMDRLKTVEELTVCFENQKSLYEERIMMLEERNKKLVNDSLENKMIIRTLKADARFNAKRAEKIL